MRSLLLLLLFAFAASGCATTETDPEVVDWPMPKKFKVPPESMWGNRRQHPVGLMEGSVAVGQFQYRTAGTVNPRDENVNARLFRFSYQGWGGMTVDLLDTDNDMEDGTSAEGIDAFAFSNLPLWPNWRWRFFSRPGVFFNKINLKNARNGDVEPWSWGFRWELETEVDIIKNKHVIVSAFGLGRVGWGWGEAKTLGFTEGINSFPYGWEAGLRVHWNRLFAALSYVDRIQEIRNSGLFQDADYGFEGVNFSLGIRW